MVGLLLIVVETIVAAVVYLAALAVLAQSTTRELLSSLLDLQSTVRRRGLRRRDLPDLSLQIHAFHAIMGGRSILVGRLARKCKYRWSQGKHDPEQLRVHL